LLADIFKFDSNYLENAENYNEVKAEILGEGSSDNDEGTFENSLRASLPKYVSAVPKKDIKDRAETNFVNIL
jgi:pre-mRNA-splicing factor CWC22